MELVLFAKRNKPGVSEVKEYLKTHFEKIHFLLGEQGDKLPKEAVSYKPTILVSYISPWIIPEEALNQTKLWNINFHPGPPNHPGIGCINFAIYNREKQYGVTAHLMHKKVDRGKIIGVKKFPIIEKETIYSLTLKSYGYLLVLFYEIFDHIIKYKVLPECRENWIREPYTRKQLEELCKITPNMSKEEVERRVRATQFPRMPGAYIELYGYKFEYNKNR